MMTAKYVDVRKAYPAVHFYDEKTGQRYTLKGEAIPPKAPKPPKPPTERKKRKPATAIGPQPRASTEHREGSRGGASNPSYSGYRMRS